LHTEFFEIDCPNLRDLRESLWHLSRKYNFLIFEDRKFYYEATIMELAFRNIVRYVDLVTVIPVSDDIFDAIEKVALEDPKNGPKGCLAVCELSFKNNALAAKEIYCSVASRHPGICCGIIAQSTGGLDPINFITATPGINISQKTDGTGQNWRGPEEAMADGTDILIVGRGITMGPEDSWEPRAKMYKEMAFEAYIKQVTRES